MEVDSLPVCNQIDNSLPKWFKERAETGFGSGYVATQLAKSIALNVAAIDNTELNLQTVILAIFFPNRPWSYLLFMCIPSSLLGTDRQ